jgi:hypothetical protein
MVSCRPDLRFAARLAGPICHQLRQIGLLRASYSGVMARLRTGQPLARYAGSRQRLLIGGTALAGVAYLIAGRRAACRCCCWP